MVSTSLFDLVALRKDLEDYRVQNEAGFEYYEREAYALLKRYGSAQSIDGVIPGHLYLGNRERARDDRYLATIGVTDVLVMGSLPTDDMLISGSKIRFKKVTMPDALGFPIMGILRSALHYVVSDVFCGYQFEKFNLEHVGDTIKRHNAPNGRTLFVHCMQGVSRSASFVILYLMFRIFLSLGHEDKIMVPLSQIVTKVQRVRQSCPNPSFYSQLQLLSECLTAILQANYSGVQANSSGVQANSSEAQANFSEAQAKSSGAQANSSEAQAKSSGVQANSSGVQANSSEAQANSSEAQANSSEAQTNLYKLRLSQFDAAMSYCEVYFETSYRCIAETFSFISAGPLRDLRLLAQRSLSLGLLVWSSKSSPLRKSQPWFLPALILENFDLYVRLLPVKGIIDMEYDTIDSFKVSQNVVQLRFRQPDVINLYGRDPEIIEFPLIMGGAALKSETQDIPKLSYISQRVLSDQPNIGSFKVPRSLYFTSEDPETRIGELVEHCCRASESTKDCWDPLLLTTKLHRDLVELELVLDTVLVSSRASFLKFSQKKYACKTWSLWLVWRAKSIVKSLAALVAGWCDMIEKAGIAKRRFKTDQEAATEIVSKKRKLKFSDVTTSQLQEEIRKYASKLRRLVPKE